MQVVSNHLHDPEVHFEAPPSSKMDGNVCRCEAPERGEGLCEAEMSTGSVTERSKR
jgi:hypothetical protein